jgi:predicted GIY-YIG superfamily endonuclease
MKKSFLSLFNLAFVLLIFSCTSPAPAPPAEVELEGQVFIVTQGGTNFKLGLVEVKAIEEPLMQSFVQQKGLQAIAEYEKYKTSREAIIQQIKVLEEEFKAAERKWKRRLTNEELFEKVNDAEKRLLAKKAELPRLEAGLQFYYGGYWITDLPEHTQMAKTDADGAFILRLKPGRYALVADAQRKVVDKTEEYYWLVWVEVKPEQKDRIFLSNDNLLRTFCAECVIKPEDIPNWIIKK